MKKINALILCIVIAVFVVFIDQATKLYAQNSPAIQINEYIRIEAYYNYGLLSNIALSEGGIILIGILIIVLFILKHQVIELKRYDIISMMFFGLLIGGSTSHIFELWFRGEVVDFIFVKNPLLLIVTNVADISVIIGFIGIVIISIPHMIQENKKNRKIVRSWIQKKHWKERPIITNTIYIIGSIIIPASIIKNIFYNKKK